ncbi:MAG TPA: hypothetical protein VKA05_00405, partial [Acidimicrobiales bacterium]|nr:hypothetical protein [Acidimicrobiales bacterium]
DMETGETVQVDPSYVREDYRQRIAGFLDRCRKLCADCQIDHVLMDTSEPYDRALSRYLERRARP